MSNKVVKGNSLKTIRFLETTGHTTSSALESSNYMLLTLPAKGVHWLEHIKAQLIRNRNLQSKKEAFIRKWPQGELMLRDPASHDFQG